MSLLLPRSTRFYFCLERFLHHPGCRLIFAINRSTQDAPAGETSGAITWAKTDYKDKEQLAQILQGTHTLLSFIGDEPTAPVQKNLIDAAVQAGVKRFAPSEWAS